MSDFQSLQRTLSHHLSPTLYHSTMARHPLLIAFAGLALSISQAAATWSIVFVDSRTGEMGIASATCLANFDLQANSPVVVVGRGMAAAQSSVDVGGANRTRIRDALLAGTNPAAILQQLAAADLQHQTRQYGLIDRSAQGFTFTGAECNPWAGGLFGSFSYTYAGQVFEITYSIQGNILTGEPVVNAALAAAINTPGDMPARLMAAMQAASVTGGDSRCSCTGTPPCPPPTFAKSSDCAYYIVSRVGDADASALSLPSSGNGQAVAIDLSGDGKPELIVPVVLTTNPAPTRFMLFTNQTPTGSVTPSFAPSINYPCVASPLAAAAGDVGDVTGDLLPDVFIAGGSTAANAPGAITYYRNAPVGGGGGGALNNPVDLATTRRSMSIVLADVDGRNGKDILYCTSTQVFARFNQGNGTFADAFLIGGVTAPNNLFVADLNSDGFPDVGIGAGFAGVRYFPGRGDGTFATFVNLAMPATLRGTIAVDFDGDGDPDLASITASAASTLAVRLNMGGAAFASARVLDTGTLGASLNAADINGDGRPDLAYTDSLFRLDIFLGNGDGTFAPVTRQGLVSPVGTLTLADLNGDALPEAILNNGAMTILSNNRGRFLSSVGFASGNYFLNFNIANQAANAPDPVLQLRTAFDAMRTQLIGLTDAVQTRIAMPTNLQPGKPGAYMTVDLRDYRGMPVTSPPQTLTFTRQGNGPYATSGGTVENLGGGRYRVLVSAIRYGTDTFTIVANDSHRPVTLMPAPALTLTKGPNLELQVP